MSDTNSTGPWSRNGAPSLVATGGAEGQLSANLTLVSLLRGQAGTWEGALWRGRWQDSKRASGQSAPVPVAVRFGSSAEESVARTQLEHFQGQTQICASLNDPRFIQILECGRSPFGLAYQAMELLENASLRDLLHASGSLPLEQAVAIAWQTTEALTKLHASGKSHGRLRAEHIFPATDSSPRLKLSAPGLLAATAPAGNNGNRQAYESPARLLQGQPPSPQDDLWTLAVTLYESLTTILPFEAATQAATAVAICSGQFAPPSRFRAELPMGIDLWFARALSSDPQNRFRTAQELFNGFSQACRPGAAIAGLSRLDEEADDEKTAQWSLPDDWLSDNSRSPIAAPPSAARPPSPVRLPVSVGAASATTAQSASAAYASLARPAAAVPPILSSATASQLPMAPIPLSVRPGDPLGSAARGGYASSAPRASGVPAVGVPLSTGSVVALSARPRSNPLSLMAGVFGLALLVSLAVWRFLPNSLVKNTQTAVSAEAKTGNTASDPPVRAAAGALKATVSEAPLRTINAAEFLAGNDGKAADTERAAEGNSKTSALRGTRTKRNSKKLRSGKSRKTVARSKKSSSKRGSRRRKSSSKKNDCVIIDAQGIRRIKSSCL